MTWLSASIIDEPSVEIRVKRRKHKSNRTWGHLNKYLIEPTVEQQPHNKRKSQQNKC